MRVDRGEIMGAQRTSDFQSGRWDLMGILLGRAESMAAHSAVAPAIGARQGAQTIDAVGRACPAARRCRVRR